MTPRTFPLPNKWSTRPMLGMATAVVLFAGFGVFWAAAAAFSALDRDWLRAVFLVLASATFLALASAPVVGDRMYRRADPSLARIELTDNTMRVLPDRNQHAVSMGISVTFIVTGLLFAVGTWTSTLDLPIGGGFEVFYPPFALLAVLLVTIKLVRMWLRGSTYGQLVLGPSFISHETGERKTELRWSDITRVSINTPRSGRNDSAACIIYLHPGDRTQSIEITTNLLSTGCAPTYWLVKYYFEHPEDRLELGDHRAIDRLMSGRVVTTHRNHL